MRKFRSFLVFLCSALISGFIFFLIGVQQENTPVAYQQLLWEFTRHQKLTSLTTATEEICLLNNAVHDALGNKNLPELVHVLALHENTYLELAADYEAHYSNGLLHHFTENDFEHAPSLDDIKQKVCN